MESAVAVEELLKGRLVQSRYRVVGRLGKGGMGAVYEAVDERLGTRVALKQNLAAGEYLQKQFEGEARLLASLNHRALPRVTDYFVEGGQASLVMEFVAGENLADVLSEEAPFPRERVIVWADQVLDALVYLHEHDRRIIHRDIKPHNLKLTPAGTISLLDFGLAKARGSLPEDEERSVHGFTQRYSPIEQIKDLGTSERSDIYALGATLYHLLTGVKPPGAESRAASIVSGAGDCLRRADEVLPVIGSDLAAILTRAMALDQEDRFGRATEFREALRGLGRGVGHASGIGVLGLLFPLRRFTYLGSRRRTFGLIAALLVIAFVATALLSDRGGKNGDVSAAAMEGFVTTGSAGWSEERVRVTGPKRNVPEMKKASAIQPTKAPKVTVERLPIARKPTLLQGRPLTFVKDRTKKARRGQTLPPEIFRAPDGTEVMRFRDGRVQVYGVGERRDSAATFRGRQ